MHESLRSEVVGTAALALLACAALVLGARRPLRASAPDKIHRTQLALSIGLLIQSAHFAEEYFNGFHQRYPPLLGLAPWSPDFFVIFNLCWLAIWTWALVTLRRGSRLASAAVWFFALAAIANGVAHPIFAVLVGGYFPGLFTAPFLGAAGVWLLIRLCATAAVRPRGTTLRHVALALETIAFTLVVPGAVTFWIPFDVLGFEPTNPTAWTVWHILAIVPLTIGFSIYVWCVYEFATRGRGIPAPVDHPKQLVVSGLYQYVRNPMYVGVLLFLIGESLLMTAWRFLLYTLAWWAFVHINVILYEEPNLRRKFGGSYEQYRSAVGRWIPGRSYSEHQT